MKYPMAPMIRKPNPTAWLILRNSRLSAIIETSCQSRLYHLAVLNDLAQLRRTEHTLCASVHEEHAILDEVLGDISELLEGVRHGDWSKLALKLVKQRGFFSRFQSSLWARCWSSSAWSSSSFGVLVIIYRLRTRRPSRSFA